MRSLKFISRGIAAVLFTVGLASAQLMNTKTMDVVRVDNVGISAGKVDSVAQFMGQQYYRGKAIPDSVMKQLRYMAVESLVSNELLKLQCKKKGFKVSAAAVDSAVNLYKYQMQGDANFQAMLKKSGMSFEQFKKNLEETLSVKRFMDKEIPYPKDPTEEERKAYWTLHKGEVTISDSVSGYRIYTKTKGKSAQEISDAKDVLKGFAAQLRSAKLPFDQTVTLFMQTAAKSSDDEDAKKTGGFMKAFPAKSKGDAFVKAIAKINVGEMTEVITEKDGVYLFLLAGRSDGKYESYKNEIDYRLRLMNEQTYQTKLAEYVKGLAKVYKIQYLDAKYTPPQALGK